MKTCYPLFRAERLVDPSDAVHIGSAVQRLLRGSSATAEYSAGRPDRLHLSLFNAGDYNGMLRSAANNEQALIHSCPAAAHREELERRIAEIPGSSEAVAARVIGVTAVGRGNNKLALMVRSEQLENEHQDAVEILRDLGGMAIESSEPSARPLLHITVAEAVGDHNPDVVNGVLKITKNLPVVRLEPVMLNSVQPQRLAMAISTI